MTREVNQPTVWLFINPTLHKLKLLSNLIVVGLAAARQKTVYFLTSLTNLATTRGWNDLRINSGLT